MSGKNYYIDQIWCRILGQTLIFQITFDRSGTRISSKIHCDFHQKNGFWSIWRAFSALGRLHRFQDHGRELWGRRDHRYWQPHP